MTTAPMRHRIDRGNDSNSAVPAPETPLNAADVAAFHSDGYLLVRNFYDVETQIRPIQKTIHRLIGLLIRKYDLPIAQQPFAPEHFDSGYQQLIAHDRSIGGEIYDAVKQIPEFVRLVSCSQHCDVVRQLRNTDLPAVAAGGYGIRIDNPGEEKFRAPWHQDYSAQFRSMDGIVFWSPLLAMTKSMGPVEVCKGSHAHGLVRVHTQDQNNPEKTGAYALILEDEQKRIASYEHAAPLTEPGDLLILDYLTIHRSGSNVADRSRWSMQMRFFNFEEPTGQKIRWSGAYAAGADLKAVHPELYID